MPDRSGPRSLDAPPLILWQAAHARANTASPFALSPPRSTAAAYWFTTAALVSGRSSSSARAAALSCGSRCMMSERFCQKFIVQLCTRPC